MVLHLKVWYSRAPPVLRKRPLREHHQTTGHKPSSANRAPETETHRSGVVVPGQPPDPPKGPAPAIPRPQRRARTAPGPPGTKTDRTKHSGKPGPEGLTGTARERPARTTPPKAPTTPEPLPAQGRDRHGAGPKAARPNTQGPNAPHTSTLDAGWSSPVARQAHNLKVRGSNPPPA